jgi:hypothetical protein
MFVVFFFFSRALMKRTVEMDIVSQSGRKDLRGRRHVTDEHLSLPFGLRAASLHTSFSPCSLSATIGCAVAFAFAARSYHL